MLNRIASIDGLERAMSINKSGKGKSHMPSARGAALEHSVMRLRLRFTRHLGPPTAPLLTSGLALAHTGRRKHSWRGSEAPFPA